MVTLPVLVEDLPRTEALERAITQTCEVCKVRGTRDRQRVVEDLVLRFYFGGKIVARLRDPGGNKVLAAFQPGRSDPKLFQDFIAGLSQHELANLTILFPEQFDLTAICGS
jgi:hypothetical protein